MKNKVLFVLVEGNDDERFFESIVKPFFVHNYREVRIWQYSQRKKGEVNRYLKGLKKMQGAGLASYFIVADQDRFPCVMAKKRSVSSEFKHATKDRMLIVCKMIEGWYLAGLSPERSDQIGIYRTFVTTNHITKQLFNSVIPERFESRIDFMKEILKEFDCGTARYKNASFNYFMRKRETDEDWK